MTDNSKSYFVTSKNFHGDNDYVEWLKEIKSRYQAIRNRVVMQSNYGALEFNWLLGRDIVQKGAESRWGSGAVNQLSLDLKAAYPDVKGFSVRNLYYMKEWYEFYMADDEHKRILHQLGAKLQESENQNIFRRKNEKACSFDWRRCERRERNQHVQGQWRALGQL